MDSIGEYEAWKAKQKQAQVGQAAVVLGSTKDQPDQLAGDLNLASEFGKVTGSPVPPAPLVRDNNAVFQSLIDQKRAETILSSSPRLTQWLTNTENATLAKDDLEGLSRIETVLGATKNSLSRATLSAPQTINQFTASEYAQDAADLKRSFGDILYDERTPLFDANGKEVDRAWVGPGDLLGAAWRYYDSRIAGGLAALGATADPAKEAAAFQMRADEVRQKISGLAMSPGAQVVRDKMGTIKGAWQEQLVQFGQIIADDPAGFTSFIGQVAAESLPALGISTAVGVATRNPTAAATTMGALSGVREYGSSAGDVVAQSGYDLSTPEGALAAISDEALMRRANEVGQTRALIIGALDGLSGGLAGKTLAANPVGNMVLQSLTQAGIGSGGEALGQYASGQNFSLSDVLLEGIAEFATTPVEVGGMAVAKVREGQSSARAAQDRIALFQELSGQAVNSKLRARMPDRFRQFVEAATANGPVENVFVPAEQFQKYFQSAGIDPMAIVDQMDGVTREDLDAALANGGDLRIPTATYAAKIAGSEHDAFLMENMRFDPTEMTAKEAADFNARVDDVMQEMWAEAEDIRQDDERWRSVEDKIHDEVVSSARMAGLSTEEAMTNVQTVVAFYRTRAVRMGLTTEEYLDRHPLPGIKGSIPQGMQFKNVDELNRTLAEARNRRAPAADKRQSLLQFIDGYGGINDVGGELSARDASVIKQGVGKKNLRLARDDGGAGQGSLLGPNLGGKKYGADDVAQAAIEAGFMADNPLVIEYKAAMLDGGQIPDITRALWDAIDAELQGNKQASNQEDAPADTARLDEIEQYMNSLGVDLSNTDDEIRAAIEADQAVPAQMYGQDGALKTDSAAFKAWFGASKVVDADGKPLVVYHGTGVSFEAFQNTMAGRGFTQSGATKRVEARAFFFTEDAEMAGEFGDFRAGGEGSNILPVYLSVQNPIDLRAPSRGMMPGFGNAAAQAAFDGYGVDPQTAQDVQALLDDAGFVEYLRSEGFDGAKLNEDNGQTAYAVFDPRQIKSVFNRGTFDANDPRILYQFAGPQSNTADIHALATARDRIDAGANEETVRRETGWFRGPDLKWRYEITDEDAKLVAFADSMANGDEVSLGDILSHPRLFAAYPDLALIPITVDNSLKAWGQVNGYGSEMILNLARIKSEGGPDALLSTLLHEIQHLIQRREGFARGGNTEMAPQVKRALTSLVAARKDRVSKYYIDNRDDFTKADNARRMLHSAGMYQDFNRLLDYARMDRPSGVFRHIRNAAQWLHDPVIRSGVHHKEVRELYSRLYVLPKRGTKRNEFLRQYAFDLGQLLRKTAPEDDWQLLADDPRKTASLMKALERESAKASAKLKPYQILKDDARLAEAQADKAKFASPFEIYQLLAGEVEARNTENRAKMTEAERAAVSPDATATADQIAYSGNKEKRNLSTDEVIVVLQTGEITSPYVANSEGPANLPAQPEMVEVDGIELPLNPDGTVTLYHGTTAAAADQILKTGILRSAAEPTVYLTTAVTADTGYGDGTVVAIDVRPDMLRLDDEFPDGRADFAIDMKAVRIVRSRIIAGGSSQTYNQSAYHGTPHLFDKFSTDNIGTGEGAQAFGWGLYFAGRKEVAEHYRETLNGGANGGAKRALAKNTGDVDASISDALAEIDRLNSLPNSGGDPERLARMILIQRDKIRALEEFKANGKFGSGRLFKVEIPEDTELLDWDAPLSKQAPAVREKLKPLIEELRSARMNEFDRKEILSGKATAELFYRAFEQHMAAKNGTGRASDPQAASEALRDAGIPGHRYLDGGSRADGDGSRNYVIYDDSRVQVSSFEQNTQGPRGQISFNMDGSSIIRLFEQANLSTMQHEMGHLFLTMMQRDVASGDAGSVAEYEVIKTWWRDNAAAVAADGNKAMPDAKLTAEDVQRAIDTGSTGDIIKDAAVDVGMQEQWARGYEAYLMEGKSPSVELRGAFEKFRSWMISVYKSLVGLNVKISPEIRAVFDRMLATDEEIAKAKQSSGGTSQVFTTAEQMGLTAEQFDRLMKLRTQSEDEAKARLQVEIMAPIRRETEKAYMAEKAVVTEEITRRVNAMPVFRALEWLGNRRWLGDTQPDALPDMRMSKEMLVARYGEGILKTLPRGMQTIYTVEGGMDPDEVAGWFGFDSGDKMLRLLERAPKRSEAIKAEVEAEMYRRHGDPLKSGEIESKALDAIHTDRRGEWLAAELKAVADVAGVNVALTMKDARASARLTINRMKVRDATASNRFLAAERKAGEEAARLGAMLSREKVWMDAARRKIASNAKAAIKGDATVNAVAGQIDKANASTGNYNDTVKRLIEAKRRQLMNHALFMEARNAADEVAKAEGYVQKLNKASMREKIAGAGRRENAQTDYLSAIDEILVRYDFRKMSAKAEDRRGALLAFVDAMKAAGRENQLAIPEAVLRAANRTPYKTLTVEELRGVVDSLKNIQHIALRWNDLIDAKNKAKLDEAVADIAAAFDANMPKRPPGRVKSAGEGMRHAGRQFLDLVLNAGTILREIDGFKDMGAAYRYLKSPIDEAMDRLTVRKQKAAADMETLYSVYSKEDRRRMAVREFIPALGYSLSKWERIAVALNTGNEGNMQRLTDPQVKGSLSPLQVTAVLGSLDARDADFVQSVWDYVGTFRDDIGARERRTTGVEPSWVDASPVDIAGKTLKGGYYPLKYDPRLSTLARDDETQSMAEALQAGRFGKAQTKRGHLEARSKSSGRDVELDMAVLNRHVNQVIYDLELSEAVANSWKLLQSGAIRQSFMDAGRQADFDALEIWLKDVAEGQLSASDWIGKTASRFKSNFTAAKLAFNMGTVMAQVTGLSQTMVVVGKKDFVRGLQASFRVGIADEIAAKSPFMASRRTTFNKDISDFYDDPSLGPTASRWGEIKRDWIGPAAFWMMTKTQWTLVDIPTWMGGYHQGLRQYGNDEAKAVAHADAIVKRAQASGLFSDRSAIERGSVSRTARQNNVVRLFTTLGSYMFAKANVAYERGMKGVRVIGKEGVSIRSAQEIASLTIDMAFLFTVEAVVMAALKGRLPDGEDDEDEGWAAFLAKETAFSILGTIPFVRDVTSVGQGFEGGGAYGGITAEMAKPFIEMSQGEIDKGFVKSVISGTGLALGLPSSQINRGVDASWRALEGEDVSIMEYLLGRMGK